ncbi:MAG TPA: FadR/GntR family transcriptional regulator [Mycobacteriales bacterium]
MTEEALKPIRRSRLYEEVADRLREFIDVHQLKPGDRLVSERDLAVRLGVSRTSVRQALTVLRTIGLVEIRHGEGVYLLRPLDEVVEPLTDELVHSNEMLPATMEVREALETQAARLAARRRTQADLDTMAAALRMMDRAIEAGENGEAGDAQFHQALTRAAGNPLLAQLMGSLHEHIRHSREASLSRPGRPALSRDSHQRILAAVTAQDPDAAAAAMREHLFQVGDVGFVDEETQRVQA